jgi:zinc protease
MASPLPGDPGRRTAGARGRRFDPPRRQPRLLPFLTPVTTVLPNGLTLLVQRDGAAPAVAIVTYVRAGYFDETDDVVGIAHVLEHMYFKGTPTRGVGDIARATKASGGYLNAHTIYDHTSYYTVVPAAGFADALAIQADAYANSLIDPGELAKEIEVIVQEVRRKEDTPAALAGEALYALLYDNHRIRRWRMGRPEALRTFTRDQVLGFYRNFYQPSNTLLSIVGDVDVEQVQAAVDARYGPLPNRAVNRVAGPSEADRLPQSRYREWSGDIVETQIVFGWRTVPTLHPDTPLLDLAAMILGTGRASRLYRGVRERRLASTATASNYTPSELGVFVVHAECPPDRAIEAAQTMWAEIAHVREEGVEPRELLGAPRLLESRWVRRSESVESQASYFAEWQALGDASLGDRYLERALEATPHDVTEAIGRYLLSSEVAAIVYRPTWTPELATSASDLVSRRDGRAPDVVLPIAVGPLSVGSPRSPRRPELEEEEGGVRVYRTATGVPILIRRQPGARMTHVGVVALGGVRDEHVDRAGLTSLVVRGAVKGAAGRAAPQLADAIEMLGASLGGSVSSDSFGWMISVPLRHTMDAVRLLADVVQEPTLSATTIDTERTLALVELANLHDDMYRFPFRLATEAAYGEHPYGLHTIGSDRSLPRLTADDVRSWHAERVLHAPVVIGIVTDGDDDALAAGVGQALGRVQYRPPTLVAPPRWPDAPTTRSESRDKSQTAIAVAFPGPARADADRFVAQLIASVSSGLGGRFFDELRDRRSLAYTVQAFAVERANAGMFVGYIATSPDKEETARAGLLREFEKIAHDGVTQEELRRAQAFAIGTHAISRQSGGAILGEMLDAWLVGRGVQELDRYEHEIRRVAPADVARVAARYFDPRRVVEGIVRGRSAAELSPSDLAAPAPLASLRSRPV